MSGEEVVEEVKKESPDFVGITLVTPLINSALDVSKGIKEELPTAKIILGGPHIHFLHEEVIKEDFVDFCVRGEGELTAVELVKALSEGEDRDRDLREVKEITFKNNDKIVVNQDRPFIHDLDLLPFPARDLLPNYRRYIMGEEEKFTAMLASRGCPFRCHFCDGRIGLMTAELLKQMKKAGCQYIFYGIEFGDQ